MFYVAILYCFQIILFTIYEYKSRPPPSGDLTVPANGQFKGFSPNINFPFLKKLQAVQTMIVGDSNKQHEATLGKGNAPLGIGVEGNSLIFLCLRNMNLLPTSVCLNLRHCQVHRSTRPGPS